MLALEGNLGATPTSGRLLYALPADLRAGAAHAVHAVKMASALRRLGQEVLLIVRSAPSGDELAASFGVPAGLDAVRVGKLPLVPASMSFAVRVTSICRRGDRVLTRHLLTGCLTSLMGTPTLLELHSPLRTLRARLLFRLFLRSRGMAGFITITHLLKNKFEAEFGGSARVHAHVLPDSADPRPRLTRARGLTPVVGYTGSFLPGKGVELVLRIAAEMPGVRFVLVGGTPADVPGIRVPSNVELTGRVCHADAVAQIDRMDVVLLPNQRHVIVSNGKEDIGTWTSPLKLFEYMAAGKPIVASRLPVLEEILVDGRNCLLADPGDPGEWVGKIRLLLDDPVAASKLGEGAREQFERQYTWDFRASRTMCIFAGGE